MAWSILCRNEPHYLRDTVMEASVQKYFFSEITILKPPVLPKWAIVSVYSRVKSFSNTVQTASNSKTWAVAQTVLHFDFLSFFKAYDITRMIVIISTVLTNLTRDC